MIWGVTLVVVALTASAFVLRIRWRAKRLLIQYGDPKVVRRIMEKTYWQGQTRDQLLEALGQPAAVDEEVLKSKTKETWKYGPRGRRRYGLKIHLENDVVVGWEQRDGPGA